MRGRRCTVESVAGRRTAAVSLGVGKATGIGIRILRMEVDSVGAKVMEVKGWTDRRRRRVWGARLGA